MSRRWIVFLAALAGSALLATGLAVAVNGALTLVAPAPHLATVPAGTLTRAGYTLAAAEVPPYCGVEQAAAAHGWLPGGAAGCPVSREAAVAAAAPARWASVLETLLARVSASGPSAVGQDRLTWLVVERRHAMILPLVTCAGPSAGRPCPARWIAAVPTAVAFVDARTAQVLEILPASVALPAAPLPVPTLLPLPPVLVPASGTAKRGG